MSTSKPVKMVRFTGEGRGCDPGYGDQIAAIGRISPIEFKI